MNQYSAKLSRLRIAPRKVRLVADLVRGEKLVRARHDLHFSTKRGSVHVLKLLESAVSNAKGLNENIDEDKLFIKKITVDEGQKMKRFRPVSRGRAHPIEKKTSHITIVLAEQEQSAKSKGQIANSKKKQVTKNKVKNN